MRTVYELRFKTDQDKEKFKEVVRKTSESLDIFGISLKDNVFEIQLRECFECFKDREELISCELEDSFYQFVEAASFFRDYVNFYIKNDFSPEIKIISEKNVFLSFELAHPK